MEYNGKNAPNEPVCHCIRTAADTSIYTEKNPEKF